jgi:hypothetical protein
VVLVQKGGIMMTIKIPEKVGFKPVAVLFLATLLACGFIFYVVAQTPTSTHWIESGIYPGAPSYTVWKEGSNYFAKDANGQIDYSGSDADTVINAVANSLTQGILYLTVGTYVLDSGIVVSGKDKFQIIGEGMGTVLDIGTEAITAVNFTDSGTGWFNGISNLQISGDSVSFSASSIGLNVFAQNQFTISKVYIGYVGTGFTVDQSFYLNTNAFEIYGCDTGVLLNRVNNALFSHLTVMYCTGNGLTSGYSNAGTMFVEPTFEQNGANGLSIEKVIVGLTIIGGYFGANSGYGLFISGESTVYPSIGVVVQGGYYTENLVNIGVGRANMTNISGVYSRLATSFGIEVGNYTSFFTQITNCWLEDSVPIYEGANAYNVTITNVPQYP